VNNDLRQDTQYKELDPQNGDNHRKCTDVAQKNKITGSFGEANGNRQNAQGKKKSKRLKIGGDSDDKHKKAKKITDRPDVGRANTLGVVNRDELNLIIVIKGS
jgi:hypothetical protein